jgi:hypothetical protein
MVGSPGGRASIVPDGIGRGAACKVNPRAKNRIPFAARRKSALRRSRSGAAPAFPCGWSKGFAGNREENAVAAWAPRRARGFRMELNPTGVKDRQIFHATFGANAGWLDDPFARSPVPRHAAIPALEENCEAKRIPPGNRQIETLEVSAVSWKHRKVREPIAEGYHADSRLRPRTRRVAIILRPPTVAIRARNPCRRLRTILLGWKVRFTAPLQFQSH